MGAEQAEDPKYEPLIRMKVACDLALGSLQELPHETAEKLRDPIETLCTVAREELVRLDPSLASRFN